MEISIKKEFWTKANLWLEEEELARKEIILY